MNRHQRRAAAAQDRAYERQLLREARAHIKRCRGKADRGSVLAEYEARLWTWRVTSGRAGGLA